MALHLEIGDKVRLNDYGLKVAFGTTFGLSSLKTKVLKIEEIKYIELSDADDYLITVDDYELSQLILYTRCFDLVEKAHNGV